ncbi:hypothetical protein E0Z06_09230 [Rheinheimera sp. D18]|uniref:hypothetical protein n=1 Tax=Rheinheimera sp. D18 TaxID=2545632 RepID=UPI00104B08FC|nr:hypothetical protein [Rheinheimera sp. D18]QBL09681.1 hypothetical protein E0Z06_09230 [Rheinheimera sp. D18]
MELIFNRSKKSIFIAIFLLFPFFLLSLKMIFNLLVYDLQPVSEKYYAAYPTSVILGLILYIIFFNEIKNKGKYLTFNYEGFGAGLNKSDFFSWENVSLVRLNTHQHTISLYRPNEIIIIEQRLGEYSVDYEKLSLLLEKVSAKHMFKFEVF